MVQTQIELWSDPIDRTSLCSKTEITGSGKRFERTIVWTMVWFRSDQRSIRSGRSDHSLYSLDHGLGLVWSEVNSVWKAWFRVHYFFNFFCFFLLRDVGSVKRQQKSSVPIRDSSKVRWLWSETRSPADSKCRSPQEEILINWRPRRFLWKAV